MKITATRFLLHADCLEEKSLAFHIHIQKRQLPETRRDLRLFDFELASRIQMS